MLEGREVSALTEKDSAGEEMEVHLVKPNAVVNEVRISMTNLIR
jgi:hypothetical protein